MTTFALAYSFVSVETSSTMRAVVRLSPATAPDTSSRRSARRSAATMCRAAASGGAERSVTLFFLKT